MEFDKSRVFSALNADELKPGDKVIVANSIGYIKDCLKKDDYEVTELTDILGEFEQERFGVGEVARYFSLAYLVERAENCTNCGEICPRAGDTNIKENNISNCSMWKPKTEPKAEMPELISLGNGQYVERKHYRPFKDTDELIKVWSNKCPAHNHRDRGLTMPFVWVRRKNDPKDKGRLITGFGFKAVSIGIEGNSMKDLFDEYEFLDGSPCGEEE